MPIDASTAECRVRTYKEGLLSTIAHDLEIRVERFTIEIDEREWHLDARFDAGSLRVVGALRDGVLVAGALSDGDKRTIEEHIVTDVLESDRFPEIRFVAPSAEAGGDVLKLAGTLTLHGIERPLAVAAQRDGRRWIATVRIDQPAFGIRPYRAMLGALRVQAFVSVHVIIPIPASAPPGAV